MTDHLYVYFFVNYCRFYVFSCDDVNHGWTKQLVRPFLSIFEISQFITAQAMLLLHFLFSLSICNIFILYFDMYFQNITPCQFVNLGLKSQFSEKVQISSFGTVIKKLIIQCAFHHSGSLIVNEGYGDLYLSVHLWFFATEKVKHQSQTYRKRCLQHGLKHTETCRLFLGTHSCKETYEPDFCLLDLLCSLYSAIFFLFHQCY